MYDNISGKIKTLAMVQCFIGTGFSIIAGFVLLLGKEGLLGLLVMVLGAVSSWMFSFLIYGFGELIEKTAQIERNTRPAKNVANAPVNPTPQAPVIFNTGNATSLKK